MKNMKTLLLLSTSLLFVSCIKETKTVSKETNNSGVADCVYTNSCIGGTTGGSSTGGTTTGTTTSGTTGTTTGTTTGGTDWGHLYPGGIPTGSCSAPSGNGYETRIGLITSSKAYSFYKPSDPITVNYINTSSMLKTESGALAFFGTDSLLKVRIKALPEPVSAKTGDTVCYGREAGSTSTGYTKMKITPSILGIKLDGTRVEEPLPATEISLNNCTAAIDLSPYKAMYPGGVYLQINTVLVNSGANSSYVTVPKTKCWQVQYEVATDTTKTFN